MRLAKKDTPERASISDESSPEAGPQAEASLAGTGTGTLVDREARPRGQAVSADLPTPFDRQAWMRKYMRTYMRDRRAKIKAQKAP